MTQINPKEKFTVFNLAHDETVHYIMSPMETWRKGKSDYESAAESLGITVESYFTLYKEAGAIIKETPNYSLISFKNKSSAQSLTRKLNKLYKAKKG